MSDGALSYCGEVVRRHDRDRFLTALFAPSDRRESLFALYAFNFELAHAREAVSEPMMGQIRLQWWRDAIAAIYEARPYRHAVIEPLAAAIRSHDLDRTRLDRLVDARERDMESEPPADLPALIDYAAGTAGELVLLALECLGEAGRSERAMAAGRAVGIAAALTGLVRAVPFHARARRLYLPRSLLDRHGVRSEDILELRRPAGLPAVAADIAREAEHRLGEAALAAHDLPRSLLPALLPGSLARLYLKRLAKARYDLFDRRVQEAPPMRVWHLWGRSLIGRV